MVMFDYKHMRVERACWELHYGVPPLENSVVHHVDGDRSNNSIGNLRLESKCPSGRADDMLRYDPESGEVTYRYKYLSSGLPIQKESAGWVNHEGYIRISAGGKEMMAHRFAYRAMTGSDVPKGMEIDHINGIRHDNRWCNLRLVDRTRNNMNAAIRRSNTSGSTGVYFDKRRGQWVAEIKCEGRKHFLGRFDTIELAEAARKCAEDELFGNHSFANSRGKK